MTATTEPHACAYPEVLIEDTDADSNLQAGMRVLLPCVCGDTPLDHMDTLEAEWKRACDALLAIDPRRALYHWAPASRRKQIIRYGLRPRMRPSTSIGDATSRWRPQVICLADSPSWAWALSGEQRHAPSGEWDLWETTLDRLHEPVVLASDARASGIHEVRTTARIFKRDLWYVASRLKP